MVMNFFNRQVWGRALLLLAAAVMAVGVQAAWAQTWKVGKNVTATKKGGTLTVSGKGDVYFGSECGMCSETPWCCDGGSITKVVIGNGITSLVMDDGNFNKLTSVTIGSGVTEIAGIQSERGAFAMLTLTTINVDPNNAAYSSVDGVLFNKDQTTLIRYPAGKTKSEYNIPSSVTSIERNAFDGCGYEDGCVGLKTIIAKNPTPPKFTVSRSIPFDEEACTLYVPQGSVYDTTDSWNKFKHIGYMDSSGKKLQVVSAVGESFADEQARRKEMDKYRKQLEECAGQKNAKCAMAMYQLGISYYKEAKGSAKPDYSTAADMFQRCSEIQGCPWQAKMMLKEIAQEETKALQKEGK
jgi:hypothetical protein